MLFNFENRSTGQHTPNSFTLIFSTNVAAGLLERSQNTNSGYKHTTGYVHHSVYSIAVGGRSFDIAGGLPNM